MTWYLVGIPAWAVITFALWYISEYMPEAFGKRKAAKPERFQLEVL